MGLTEIIDRHPKLFRGEPPAVLSFVDPGWFELVDKLCTDIEAVLPDPISNEFQVEQVKEKYAALRFYFSLGGRSDTHVDIAGGSNVPAHFVNRIRTKGERGVVLDAIRSLVTAAQAESAVTCSQCGAPGQLRQLGGWLSTLCDSHLAQRLVDRKAERGS